MFITSGMVGNFEQKLPPQPQKGRGSCCESCTMKKLLLAVALGGSQPLWLAFDLFEKQKQVGSPTKHTQSNWANCRTSLWIRLETQSPPS
jgi:hypothetical protein